MRQTHHTRARVLLIAAIAAGACTTEREREREMAKSAERPGERTPTPAPPVVSVPEAKEQPKYYDKEVRVTGEIDKMYSNRAFRLEGTGWAFDDDIVVVMREPVAAAVGDLKLDDELVVTGKVRRFVVADVERDIGWDLPEELEITLKERPVLIADAVRKVGAKQPAEPTASAEQPEKLNTVAAIVTTTDRKTLGGRKVELSGERVQSVAGRGLWIGPSTTTEVFVVPATLPKDIVAGDTVEVFGTVRELPAGAEELWNLPAEMHKPLKDAVVYIDTTTIRELPAEKDQRKN